VQYQSRANKNTWFYNANIDLRQGLHIILCFVAGLRHNQAVREVKVDDKTIGNWYGFLREVQEVIVSQPRKIGGIYEDENGEIVSHFVEFDESQICNRKYNEPDHFWPTPDGSGRTHQVIHR
jgi:hypothetical protein